MPKRTSNFAHVSNKQILLFTFAEATMFYLKILTIINSWHASIEAIIPDLEVDMLLYYTYVEWKSSFILLEVDFYADSCTFLNVETTNDKW